jgi:phosphoesterase RecJ-like protein
MACSDPVPARFNYIPYVGAIVQDVSASFDLVISLDCSDLKRLGHFPQMPTFRSVPLLNIDHHLTNLDFGDVNLVDPQASSTAEVVLWLLEYMALPLDAELATCLLTGIVADTRGLRTSNVTIQVMERRTAGYAGNGDAGLVSFLVSGDDADVAVVFVEREDSRIEVSLRAVPGFDVAQVALQLGGGGHALAAGCNLPGPLGEAQARVLAALRADLARQRHT